MKAVILAGGLGTRISEETTIKPKPMVEIGGMPILWHIMKYYSEFGVDEFVILCGYKSHVIKDFFQNYILHNSSVKFDFEKGTTEVLNSKSENWKVTLVDTGASTMTGGRIKRAREIIGDETFFLTYGDGVSNVNLDKLLETHRSNNALATLTAVQPPGRFGVLKLGRDQTIVDSFTEKPQEEAAWINGGFFAVEPEALDAIAGDDTSWEQEPLAEIANKQRLGAYKHDGFWQPMDTLRDKQYLESKWDSGDAPWKIW